MNDIPSVVAYSRVFLFADDAKCFKNIKIPRDTQCLQHDLIYLSNWSKQPSCRFIHLKVLMCPLKATSYNINDCPIKTSHLHKDLGVIISNDLNWDKHHDYILKKAYKTHGFVRRTFSNNTVPSVVVKLYISLVRSQLLYCSPVWRPHQSLSYLLVFLLLLRLFP